MHTLGFMVTCQWANLNVTLFAVVINNSHLLSSSTNFKSKILWLGVILLPDYFTLYSSYKKTLIKITSSWRNSYSNCNSLSLNVWCFTTSLQENVEILQNTKRIKTVSLGTHNIIMHMVCFLHKNIMKGRVALNNKVIHGRVLIDTLNWYPWLTS